MQEPSKQQLKVILGAILFVIALVVIVLLLPGARRSLTATTIRNSHSVPSSFLVSAPYGNDTILVANQRAFIAYNYRSGSVQNVTPDSLNTNFQGVDTILTTSDKRFIVFHNNLANPAGILGNILKADGSDIYASYWWVYDTSTKTYHHFDKDITKVRLDGDTAYGLGHNDDTQTIDSYRLSDFTKTSSMPITKSDDFFPVAGGFVLDTSDNKTLFTKDGVVNTEIFDDATVVGVLGDRQHIIGTLDDPGAHLAVFDLQSKKQKTLAGNVGQVVVGQNSVLFNTTNKPNARQQFYALSAYDQDSGKVSALKLPKTLSKVSLAPNLVLQGTTYIVNGGGKQYLISKEDTSNIKDVSSDYNKSVNVGDNTVSLQYYPDTKSFLVTLDANAMQDEATAVYQQLRRDGYQPMLLNIRFTGFTPPPVNDAASPAGDLPQDAAD